MHRDVRGTGKDSFSDTRYSALNPELWTWVAVSGLNLLYQGYLRVCGRRLTLAEKEVVYQTLRSELQFLELPSKQGSCRRPCTTCSNITTPSRQRLGRQRVSAIRQSQLRRPADPEAAGFPATAARAASGLAGADHSGIAPGGRVFGRRRPPHDAPAAQCAVGRARAGRVRRLRRRVAAGLAMVAAPADVGTLAYNRYQYERLRDRYRSVLLDSFAAPERN